MRPEKLRRLLLDAEHAVPDADAVAGAHVAEVLAVDRHAEAVHAGQAPVRAAGPVMGPREARVRDQAAEARPARVLEIAVERVQVADAVAEDGDRVHARVAQILLGAQLAADQRAGRGHRCFVDQAFGRFVGDLESARLFTVACSLSCIVALPDCFRSLASAASCDGSPSRGLAAQLRTASRHDIADAVRDVHARFAQHRELRRVAFRLRSDQRRRVSHLLAGRRGLADDQRRDRLGVGARAYSATKISSRAADLAEIEHRVGVGIVVEKAPALRPPSCLSPDRRRCR